LIYSLLGDSLFGMERSSDTGAASTSDLAFLGEYPPLPLGQVVDYTIRYVNTGPTMEEGVGLRIMSFGSLRLLDGEANPDGNGYTQDITLGHLAPGEQGEVSFQVMLDPALDQGFPRVGLEIALDNEYSRRAGNHFLEWYWSDIGVDHSPPTALQVTGPQPAVARPGEIMVSGTIQEETGVQSLTLEQRPAGGSGSTHECPTTAIRGGGWHCPLTLAEHADGTSIGLRVQATDSHGQKSTWSDWYTVTVDLTPPRVEAQSRSTGIVLVGPNTPPAEVLVLDERAVAGAEVCWQTTDGAGPVCMVVPGRPAGPIARTRTITRVVEEPAQVPVTGGENEGSGGFETMMQPTLKHEEVTETFTAALVAVPMGSGGTHDGEEQTVTVTGLDSAGNRSTRALNVTYRLDHVAPTLEVTTHLEQVSLAAYQAITDSLTSGVPPILAGTVQDGSRVGVVLAHIQQPDGTRRTVRADTDPEAGTWQLIPRLTQAGTYRIRLEARDAAGNTQRTTSYAVEVVE